MDGKTVVRTEKAPAPFQGAPYSQAIKANGLVFVAGQLGFEPGSTEVVGPGIDVQTRQTFDNLEAILTEAGSGLDRIVKTTVFLASLDDFAAFNTAYMEAFGDHRPTRSTFGGGLVRGAKVEIEAWAYKPL